MKSFLSHLVLALVFLGCFECAAADSATTQLQVYEKLHSLARSNKKKAHIYFRDVLEDNPAVKLSAVQMNDLVKTILFGQINTKGAKMIVSLRDILGVNYNDKVIFSGGRLPLSIASFITTEVPNGGLKLMPALISSGARSDMVEEYLSEEEELPVSTSIRKFWLGLAIDAIKKEGYGQDDVVTEIKTAFADNRPPFQGEWWPIEAQIYGTLTLGHNVERSQLKTVKQFNQVKKQCTHICTCEYCNKPFI